MARKAAVTPRPSRPSSVEAPSQSALAIAATYRTIDPSLDDSALDAIARRIDEGRALAVAFTANPGGLRNADDLVVRFTADERY